MTACTFITCSSNNCCDCGYCSWNAAPADETNLSADMLLGNYSSDCGEDCDTTNGFCFQDQCYESEDCEGKCDDIQDCDTCFCGSCLDNVDHVDTNKSFMNTNGYQAADLPKKPNTLLACIVLAAVALIGVIGLLVVRNYKPRYRKQLGSSMEKTSVCVVEVGTNVQTSDIFF